jgi:hypothetical protein
MPSQDNILIFPKQDNAIVTNTIEISSRIRQVSLYDTPRTTNPVQQALSVHPNWLGIGLHVCVAYEWISEKSR